MISAFLRATKVSQLPGVRAALLVESVTSALAALARRQNGLTKNLRANFSYVCDTHVHFSLFINGQREGLFRFSYDPDSFEPPSLARLTANQESATIHSSDPRARALEKVFSVQLSRVHAPVWATVRVKP